MCDLSFASHPAANMTRCGASLTCLPQKCASQHRHSQDLCFFKKIVAILIRNIFVYLGDFVFFSPFTRAACGLVPLNCYSVEFPSGAEGGAFTQIVVVADQLMHPPVSCMYTVVPPLFLWQDLVRGYM